jgi:hypothetical protein
MDSPMNLKISGFLPQTASSIASYSTTAPDCRFIYTLLDGLVSGLWFLQNLFIIKHFNHINFILNFLLRKCCRLKVTYK